MIAKQSMKQPSFAYDCSPDLVERCFAELESSGVCCLENAVPRQYLLACQAQVRTHVSVQGERYFSLIQPCKQPGSAFADLADSTSFRELLRALSVRAAGPACASGVDVYNVLRVVAGPNGAERSLMFHYDATVITALVPLFIPDGPPREAGDLVALANLRPIRRSALVNVVEKALVQNTVSRKILEKILLRRGDDRHVRRLVPGNIYLFWGYRTLHANLPVKPNELRSTLLFHFGDPHRTSLLTRGILRLRKLRETRGLAKATHPR